jgi:cytochrome c-type biogenesis protein
MMQELFTSLTHAVEGSPLIALSAALIWGILSILLSPCHLASIPLIVGFIDEQGNISTWRAFTISLLFSFENGCSGRCGSRFDSYLEPESL